MSELNPNHPNQLPETAKDPFDEFSFDDLMQMDLDTPAPAATTTSTVSTPNTTPTNEVDFDSLFDFDDTPSPPAQANTANVLDLDQSNIQSANATPINTQPQTHVHNVTDPLGNSYPPSNHTVSASDDTFAQLDNLNDAHSVQSTASFSQPDLTTAPHPTMPETTAINPMDMVAGVGAAGVTAASLATNNTVNNTTQKTKSAFGGMFGKNNKPAKEKAIKPKKEKVTKTTSLTTSPKKNNKLLPLILGLLAIGGIAAWLFSQIMDKAPEPKPVAVTPVAKPTPAPVAQPSSVVAAVNVTSTATSAPMATVATASAPTTTTTVATETAKVSNATLIKPEEILAKPIPEDPALAKEEMDKLADQSARLAEQEKMMEEQLKMTKELSDKKAERIALLEQQIAQLEAQKGQAK